MWRQLKQNRSDFDFSPQKNGGPLVGFVKTKMPQPLFIPCDCGILGGDNQIIK
jgi:hypothetical protein